MKDLRQARRRNSPSALTRFLDELLLEKYRPIHGYMFQNSLYMWPFLKPRCTRLHMRLTIATLRVWRAGHIVSAFGGWASTWEVASIWLCFIWLCFLFGGYSRDNWTDGRIALMASKRLRRKRVDVTIRGSHCVSLYEEFSFWSLSLPEDSQRLSQGCFWRAH
jgi:hypothetical protein